MADFYRGGFDSLGGRFDLRIGRFDFRVGRFDPDTLAIGRFDQPPSLQSPRIDICHRGHGII